jgi:hypothetical protein
VRLYHFGMLFFVTKVGSAVCVLGCVLTLAAAILPGLFGMPRVFVPDGTFYLFGSGVIAFSVLQIVINLVLRIVLHVKGAKLDVPSSPAGRAVSPSGIWLDEDTDLQPGDNVLARWDGDWHRAVVERTLGPTRVWLHYPGWDSFWDEPQRKRDCQAPIESEAEPDRSAADTGIQPAERRLTP